MNHPFWGTPIVESPNEFQLLATVFHSVRRVFRRQLVSLLALLHWRTDRTVIPQKDPTGSWKSPANLVICSRRQTFGPISPFQSFSFSLPPDTRWAWLHFGDSVFHSFSCGQGYKTAPFWQRKQTPVGSGKSGASNCSSIKSTVAFKLLPEMKGVHGKVHVFSCSSFAPPRSHSSSVLNSLFVGLMRPLKKSNNFPPHAPGALTHPYIPSCQIFAQELALLGGCPRNPAHAWKSGIMIFSGGSLLAVMIQSWTKVRACGYKVLQGSLMIAVVLTVLLFTCVFSVQEVILRGFVALLCLIFPLQPVYRGKWRASLHLMGLPGHGSAMARGMPQAQTHWHSSRKQTMRWWRDSQWRSNPWGLEKPAGMAISRSSSATARASAHVRNRGIGRRPTFVAGMGKVQLPDLPVSRLKIVIAHGIHSHWTCEPGLLYVCHRLPFLSGPGWSFWCFIGCEPASPTLNVFWGWLWQGFSGLANLVFKQVFFSKVVLYKWWTCQILCSI